MTEHDDTATVESSLRLGSGFAANERDHIVASWASLSNRLESFPQGTVELEISVKERSKNRVSGQYSKRGSRGTYGLWRLRNTPTSTKP